MSPFLFAIVMDEITKSFHEEIPWCVLFAHDIVLIDETKEGLIQIRVVKINYGNSGV